MTSDLDILVIGHGPAGLGIAADCAERGLRTCCVGPDPDAVWHAVYGVWPDAVAGLDLGDAVERRWSDADAVLDDDRRYALGTPYAKLHTQRIQVHLRQRLLAAGGRLEGGKVRAVAHARDSSTAVLRDRQIQARVIVDASGAFSPLLEREEFHRKTTVQTTYGYMGRVKRHPFDVERMLLMDYRDGWLQAPELDPSVPTFLYAMPLSEDRLFAEETSVVAFDRIPEPVMKGRLEARLASLGVEYEEIEFVEKGVIPMATPMPRLGQRLVGFGAAANMIHPATAWQIGVALKTSPLLADVLAHGLDARRMPVARVAAAAWRVVWPAKRRYALPFHLVGGAMLAETSMEEQRGFIEAFFETAREHWADFATWELSPWRMPFALSPVYGAASPQVQRHMRESGLRHMLP